MDIPHKKKWRRLKLLHIVKKLLKSVKAYILKMLQKGKQNSKKSIEDRVRINLLIIRETYTEESTAGKLFLNGEYVCDTLENPFLNNQRNISCIPKGHYKVRLRLARESATRDYLHLLVQDVPNRDWILVHIGNYPSQTQGCILVGNGREQDAVNNSRLAMDLVIKEILNLGGENINLIIKNK